MNEPAKLIAASVHHLAPANLEDGPDRSSPDPDTSRSATAISSEAPRHDFIVTHIDAKRPAAALTEQLHDRFDSLMDQVRQKGHAEMHVDLHPPELGRMQVQIALEDGHVDVRFLVQTDGAKQALEQQWEPLRERFAQMGVSLGQFDVRKDGGSPHQEPPAEPEPPSQPLQVWRNAALRSGKPGDGVANADGLVDLIA